MTTVGDPRAAPWAALFRRGWTQAQVAQEAGVSRQRVGQVMAAAGYQTTALRDVRCAACGRRLPSAPNRRTRSGGHYCDSCGAARERAVVARRERRPRARCAHCGRELIRLPRADGRPQWCANRRACQAARQRRYYAEHPEYQAQTRERTRRLRAKAKDRTR